jgi:hypothetical protein
VRLALHEQALAPDPDGVASESVALDELQREVKPTSDWVRAHIPRVLENEPATSGAISATQDGWVIQLRPSLRLYYDVDSVDDYIDRVVDALTSPVQPSTPPVSPHTLPETIEFLDVVWQLRTDEHLVAHVDFGAVSRLGQDCVTAADFDRCTSALGQVFGSLRVPKFSGVDGPLERLRLHLRDELPQESFEPVNDAIRVLQAAQGIRTGAQHGGDASVRAARRGYAVFGLDYPVSDWRFAWSMIRARVIEALTTIRQEVQANPK